MFGIFRKNPFRHQAAQLHQFFINLQSVDTDGLGPDDKATMTAAVSYFEEILRGFWAHSMAQTIEAATGFEVDAEAQSKLMEVAGHFTADDDLVYEASFEYDGDLTDVIPPFAMGAVIGYTRACMQHGMELPEATLDLNELFTDEELAQHIEAVERVTVRLS